MMKYGKKFEGVETVQQLKDALCEFDPDMNVMTIFDEPLQVVQMLDYDSGDELYLQISGSDT